MKRMIPFLIFPLMVSWQVDCKTPVPCQKNDTPNPYTGSCTGTYRTQPIKQFTELKDFTDWYKAIPTNDPVCTVSNVKTFQYDETGKYVPQVKSISAVATPK